MLQFHMGGWILELQACLSESLVCLDNRKEQKRQFNLYFKPSEDRFLIQLLIDNMVAFHQNCNYTDLSEKQCSIQLQRYGVR